MNNLLANQEHSAEQVRAAMQQLSAIELQVLRATGILLVRFLQEKQRRERGPLCRLPHGRAFHLFVPDGTGWTSPAS